MVTSETQTLDSPEGGSPVTPSHLVMCSFDPPAQYNGSKTWQENLLYLAWKLPLITNSRDKLEAKVEEFLTAEDPLTGGERVVSASDRKSLYEKMNALAGEIESATNDSEGSQFAKTFVAKLEETSEQEVTQSDSFLVSSVLFDYWFRSYYYAPVASYESPQVIMYHQFEDLTAALTYAHTTAFEKVMAFFANQGCFNIRVQVFEHKDGHIKH